MALGEKESGIGMTVDVDDGTGTTKTITDDITNLTISIPRAIQDITGLSLAGVERLLLLADFSLGLNGVFNDTANQSHAVFKTVPSQSATQLRAISVAISGQAVTAETMPDDYLLTRAADGAFTWTVNLVNADGVIPAWS